MKRSVIAGGRPLQYTLIQTVRAGVLLQALPEGVIRVYAPRAMHLRDVDRLVREQAEALRAMQRDVDRHVEANRRAHPVTEGAEIMIEGAPHALRLSAGAKVRGDIRDGALALTLPDPGDDAAVRGAIRSVLSARALARIRERLAFYAPRIGVQFGRVTVRQQKTRWGSCSARGNLNFNWKLIMAPPRALDYVVIHELCHRIEFNHSPRFWRLVEAQMPDYEAWKKWLRTHRDDLYL